MKYSSMKALVITSLVFALGCSTVSTEPPVEKQYRYQVHVRANETTSGGTPDPILLPRSTPNVFPKSTETFQLSGVVYHLSSDQDISGRITLHHFTTFPDVANDSMVTSTHMQSITFEVPDDAAPGSLYTWKFWISLPGGTSPLPNAVFDTTTIRIKII
jgi:hypothetical protein